MSTIDKNFVLIWNEKKKLKSEVENNRIKISQIENRIIQSDISHQQWDEMIRQRNHLICRNHQIKKAMIVWEETGCRLGKP